MKQVDHTREIIRTALLFKDYSKFSAHMKANNRPQEFESWEERCEYVKKLVRTPEYKQFESRLQRGE